MQLCPWVAYRKKRDKEAFDIFKMNYGKNPDNFTTNMGMARAELKKIRVL